jgi:hypothetical protein
MKTVKMWGGALGVVAMMAPALASAQEIQRVSGREVTVYNLAGQVEVARGSGADVVVRITRGGADAARLDVRTGEIDGRATLRIVYPDDEIIYPAMGRGSSTSMRVRGDGTFWGDSRDDRGDPVRIRGSGSGLEAWADLVIEVPSGKDFAVYVAAGQVDVRGVQSDVDVRTGSGRVDVADVTGEVSVDTGSGSASIVGVRGSVKMDTGSGSVTVRNVEGDEVIVDTGSGGVRGGAIRTRSLRVDTGSGSIELDEVTSPNVVLDTGSGSVDLVLTADVEILDVDTGSGSVTVRAPADLGGELEIDTGSGGIDMDFAVQVRSVRRDHVIGTLGDGRGRIRIDTGSGAVRLLKN